MKTFLKEPVISGELGIYENLNLIAPQYNKKFSTLVLPQALKIDKKNRTLTLPRYEGEFFDDKWNVTNGGAPLGLDLAKEMPMALKDLSKIDANRIVSNKKLSKIPKLAFEHNEGIKYYENLAIRFKNLGALSERDILKIRNVLRFRQRSKMIFNNGDFYPCNFIRLPDGKLVLIDWETWNPHSPFYNIDHPENVAAVPFVHMWSNPRWRKAYVRELNRYFSFTEKGFKKGVVMKALALAKIFDADRFNKRGRKQLILHQMKFIKRFTTGRSGEKSQSAG